MKAMKKMMIVSLVGWLTLAMGACETSDKVEQAAKTTSVNNLAGTWVLKSILLGDMMDLPCGVKNEGKIEPITLTFSTTKDETGAMTLNGRSSVNTYFSAYSLVSFDEATQIGKIKIAAIGSTKMASTPDLMQCESRYFSMLSEAVDFQLSTVSGKTQLELGVLANQKIASPLGGKGNLLIFEKQ